MKLTRSSLRQLIKEVYVQTYRRYEGASQLAPAFEKAPAVLGKESLEAFMLKSFTDHWIKMQNLYRSKGMNYVNDATFRAARADTLRFIHDNLATHGLSADAPPGEKPTHRLVDRTKRSQLIFTKKDYRDDYEYATPYEDPKTGEKYHVNKEGYPYNPDPRMLPMQSFERVVKTSQDDIQNHLKDIAVYDSSPNAEALDDYVNSVVDQSKKNFEDKTGPIMSADIDNDYDVTQDLD